MKLVSNEDFKIIKESKNIKADLKEKDATIEYLRECRTNLEKKIENIKQDNEIEIERTKSKLDIEISKATENLKKEITRLTIENGSYKKENEILTKAFENLGFDVKDMKSILDKLVDGIVGKNTVQVIKS